MPRSRARESQRLIDTSPFRHPTAPSTDKHGDKHGEKFGQYLVYEQLGEGGMAYVHRAEMIGAAGFRKEVALKRMRTSTSEDPEFVTSFIHEGQLAGRLRHPNIAEAYELGKIDGVYFIAMEFVPGPTLAQILAQSRRCAGAIPLPIILEILIQLCDALDHAHDLRDDNNRPISLVHRDISPMNVIVSRAGTVKLIDFGIAKQRYSSIVTQAGIIKGKHAYVAPEYVAGTGFDLRVDLWGVGVVAHEMITGRRLFLGDTDVETIRNVKDMHIPPPSRIAAGVSPELDDIIMTALQRDPALRWQSAAAMRNALVAEARRTRTVISGAQIRDWIEWAFRQPTNDGPDDKLLVDLEPSHSLQMHDLEAVSGEIDDEVPTVDAVRPPKPRVATEDLDTPDKIVIGRDVLPRAAIPRLGTGGTPNPRAATPIVFSRSQTAIPSLESGPVRMHTAPPIASPRASAISSRPLPPSPISAPLPCLTSPVSSRPPTPRPGSPRPGSPRPGSPAIPDPIEPETSIPLSRPHIAPLRPPTPPSERETPPLSRRPRATTPSPVAPRPATPVPSHPRTATPEPSLPAISPRAAALAEMQRAVTADARVATPLPPDLEVSRPVVLPRSPSDLEVSRPIVQPRSPSDLDELIGHRPSEAETTRPRVATPSRPIAAVRAATPSRPIAAVRAATPRAIPVTPDRATPRLRMAVPQDARRSATPSHTDAAVAMPSHADAEVARMTPPLHLSPSDAAIPQVVERVVTSKVALAPMMLPVGRGPRWSPPTRWTRTKPRSRHLPQLVVLLMLAAFAFMSIQLGWIDLDKWRALLADYI